MGRSEEPPPSVGETEREAEFREGEVIVEVEGVTKSYDGRPILKGIDLKVCKGETVVIMGGSGHGKSTLLRLMIGAERPDSGTIKLFGKAITGLSELELYPIKRRFGVLFQSGALYNSMTVGENIALPLREHTELDEQIIKIIIKLKLELVGLRDFEHLIPAQLSGGMKKRVGLARAIALDPEIIFYDEPGAGLDPVMLAVIDELITGLGEKLGVASIVVTHEMQSAFRIADRMVLLHGGEILAEGTPHEVKHSKDPLLQQFIQGKAEGPIPLRLSSRDFAEDLLGG
ncbi:MAG: ABC transporter ATP-binding protein [Planctomycetota bacterium]|jgi:phospholipid/cholesterol/gamma-HCH transport system ATP-binding protein